MRNHPFVAVKALHMGLGYDDAEAIVRASKDPASVQAVREIDAARAVTRADAIALNKDMAARLGLSPEKVAALVATLAASPDLETWLLRRVNLTRAGGTPLADDSHPENA